MANLDPCPYCLTDVRISTWDTLVGLPVECPSCGMTSGPPWSANRLIAVLALSVVLNALVLFLVTRPLRAMVLIATYSAAVFAALTLFSDTRNSSPVRPSS